MGTYKFEMTEKDLEELSKEEEWREKKPIDVVVCLDSSGSMEATDFTPNRFEAAKKAALAFTTRKIMENYKDRVALLTFGGLPKTHLHLTDDLDKMSAAIKKFGSHTITHNSTAIGSAIEEAGKILQKEGKKENMKAIIVLTDGDNQVGIDPIKAISKLKDIPVYTIGLGTPKGIAMDIPGVGNVVVRLNEDLLKKIAKQSGGKYYHAPEVAQLIGIFEDLADL
ncbi:MAG: VWA domain-containing protein [Candidatus Aminicenantes bacterium]|nr:MAG: VWA domain-containing protein [Candidatus Aminicenantes bacterium]